MSAWVGAPLQASGKLLAPEPSLRLFVFAHAGGGSAFFRPWRFALAPTIDVRPILLPGREARIRETPYRRMEALVEPLVAGLQSYLDIPYVLFGHSLGSVIAYEVARRLNPLALFVSGRRGPHTPTTRRLFHTLPDDQFLGAIGKLNGTPPEVLEQPALLQMLLPSLRADFELNETYTPALTPRLTCPVAAYVGDSDPEVDPPELLTWRDVTDGEFGMRVFSGDHFYLKGERADVLSALRLDLGRTLELNPLVRSSVNA